MSRPTSTIEDRRLVLEEDRDLGRAAGRDEFRLHPEFWFQLSMIFDSRHHRTLGVTVSADDALALADLLRESAGDESWQIHLYLWGDEDGVAVQQFIRFLDGGGFVVVPA